jgi:hypothetical protein
MRNFGIMSGRQRLSGASSTSPSAYSAARADSIPLPAASILSESADYPPLEFLNIKDALLNVLALISIALAVCAVGIGLPLAAFIMLFVGT